MHRHPCVLVIAALAAASCGRTEAPRPETKPAAQTASPAPHAEPAPASKPASAARGAPAPLSKEKIASYRALLRDGRLKVKAGALEEGIALFEEALALRPGDPRLLVELGWAAFLAGDLQRAEAATAQGLPGARGKPSEGAALYNLGRIAEQRGDKDEAARRYRESLSARPNAAVEKRLSALGLGPAAEPAGRTDTPAELGPLEGPLQSLDAVCGALLTEAAAGDTGGGIGCARDAAQRLEAGAGALKAAWLLPVWRNYNGEGLDTAAEVYRYLVVETDRGFYRTRAEVSYVYNPGAFGIFEELESSLSAEQVVPGGSPEIVMTAKHQRADTDLGILEQESETTEWTLVCGLVGDAPRCLAKIPAIYEYERDVMSTDAIDPGEPVAHTPGLPLRSSYRYEISFDGRGGYSVVETAPPVGDAAARDGARAGGFSLLEGAPRG
jgi:tetratricopeptide (TPR) repeat protein